MLLLIKRNTAICKLASLEGYKKKWKMNEFKEKKNGEGRFLRLPRLSYRDETIRVTFAMWYTLVRYSSEYLFFQYMAPNMHTSHSA